MLCLEKAFSEYQLVLTKTSALLANQLRTLWISDYNILNLSFSIYEVNMSDL